MSKSNPQPHDFSRGSRVGRVIGAVLSEPERTFVSVQAITKLGQTLKAILRQGLPWMDVEPTVRPGNRQVAMKRQPPFHEGIPQLQSWEEVKTTKTSS